MQNHSCVCIILLGEFLSFSSARSATHQIHIKHFSCSFFQQSSLATHQLTNNQPSLCALAFNYLLKYHTVRLRAMCVGALARHVYSYFCVRARFLVFPRLRAMFVGALARYVCRFPRVRVGALAQHVLSRRLTSTSLATHQLSTN
jgi:hypothetical protein